jgi:hypothetical protein
MSWKSDKDGAHLNATSDADAVSAGECDWPQVRSVCLWGVCGKVLATDTAGEELGDFKPARHTDGGRFSVWSERLQENMQERGAVRNEAYKKQLDDEMFMPSYLMQTTHSVD